MNSSEKPNPVPEEPKVEKVEKVIPKTIFNGFFSTKF